MALAGASRVGTAARTKLLLASAGADIIQFGLVNPGRRFGRLHILLL